MPTMAFNKAKFKELLLHVAWKMQKDPWYGDIKLNKVLYFCEFRAYGTLGRPISGEIFERQPRGPVSRALRPVRDELQEARHVAIQETTDHGKTRRTTVPLRKPDLSLFSPEEVDVIDSVIDDYFNHTSDEITGESHQELGWDAAKLGDAIPYQTVFFSKPDLTAEEIEHGLRLSASLR